MKTARAHDGLRRSGVVTRVAMLLAACCTSMCLAEPISVKQFTRQLEAGPIQVFVATIDLKDPALKVISDEPLNAAAKKNAKADAKLARTDDWAEAHHATLAINANYFGLLEKAPKPATPNEDNHGYGSNLEADVIGVWVSNGVVISKPRVVKGEADPAVLIRADGTAAAKRVTDADLTSVAFAVAGVGASDTGKDTSPGSLLVQAGKNLGSTARVDADKRHPRTALGVTADGTKLVAMVVDGRAPGYSVGVTLPELADLMIENGAVDAVNLDGGGSSAFVYRPSTSSAQAGAAKVVSNRPSDGSFRPVANHLGFVVAGSQDPSVELQTTGASPAAQDPKPTDAK
ncbi:MAG: phosphodiester glycosidase family protein [Planctomycetota bacterium]|nr:phosphodiester glycosidase family protein [Planctomycetota bacterium]